MRLPPHQLVTSSASAVTHLHFSSLPAFQYQPQASSSHHRILLSTRLQGVMGCSASSSMLSDEEWRARYAPVPAGVAFSEELVDGFAFPPYTKRNVYSWVPSAASDVQVKAIVLVIHGLHEHCMRYHQVACHLVSKGFAVYGIDHIGHGLSEGQPRGHCSDANALVMDIARFAELQQAKHTPLASASSPVPTFILAHSAGGLFALRERQLKLIPGVLGLWCSAPGLKMGPGVASPQGMTGLYWVSQTKFGENLTSFLASIDPYGGAAPLILEELTSDETERACVPNDPRRYHGMFRNKAAWEGMKMIAAVKADMSKIDTPISLHHGSADQIVLPEASQTTFDGVSSVVKTLKTWEGLRHELLHEVPSKREELFSNVSNFFDSLMPQTAAIGTAGVSDITLSCVNAK